jgi:hypothetical protein
MSAAPAKAGGTRGSALATQLRTTGAALIATIEHIDPELWDQLRKPGEWSPGKDAEHAADAAALHFSRVCSMLGVAHSPPPEIERIRLTSSRSQAEVVASLQSRIEQARLVIAGLTDAQLEFVDRSSRSAAEIIQRPLIRHLETHRQAIDKNCARSGVERPDATRRRASLLNG